MRTLLIAGSFHNLLCKYGLDIVNQDKLTLDETLSFLQQTQLRYEQIVLTDDGMMGNDSYAIISSLKSLLLFQEKENIKQPILLITNNVMLQDIKISEIIIENHFITRIPISEYIKSIRASSAVKTKPSKKANTVVSAEYLIKEDEPEKKDKKQSFINRFKKDKSSFSPLSPIDKEFAGISHGISRVLAITGCRGSGVTSTAVNLAQIANSRGLSTMLIDMDVANRALNLYFNECYEAAENNKDIACSLIRNLAKPQNYNINTYNKRNLYVTTLSYSFQDEVLLDSFYITTKFINMLAVFKKHFQLCLVDMPFEALSKFKESILYIDDFGLCVSNNLYSLTGTLRNVRNKFNREELESLHSKTKIIVSKYNDQATLLEEIFSPEKVCELLLDLDDIFYDREFELAGHIPYMMDFDSQLETDIPVVSTNVQMEKTYSDILLRMIKGVR